MSSESPSASKQPAPSAEEYKKMEENLALKRGELATSSVERMSELVNEIKELEGEKNSAFDSAHDEAHAENDRIDAEQVAFDSAYEEAHIENARIDEERANESVRIAQIDEQIGLERAKLGTASADDLAGIVDRIRTLENSKTQAKEVEEESVAPDEKENLRLQSDLSMENYYLSRDKKNLETIEGRLADNREAMEKLRPIFGSRVTQLGVSSSSGGKEWQLVDETAKLRSLVSRMRKLNSEGKYRGSGDPEIDDIDNQISSLRKDGISYIWDSGAFNGGKVIVEGPHGDIGTDEVMILGEALQRSIKLHEDLSEALKTKISAREDKIKNLEAQIAA